MKGFPGINQMKNGKYRADWPVRDHPYEDKRVRTHLGYFSTLEKASAAQDLAHELLSKRHEPDEILKRIKAFNQD